MRELGMDDNLTGRLREFVQTHQIVPDPEFKVYASGVYAVVDCVFSSQARFGVVRNALRRLSERLPDTPTLSFNEFLWDVQCMGEEDYASVILTRQRIGHSPSKLKVKVACDVAAFFAERGHQTKADFRLPSDPSSGESKRETEVLEKLVLIDLVERRYGVGPVLGRYLLMLLSDERHVKPDTLLVRLLSEVGGQPLRNGHAEDMELIRHAVTAIATEMKTTPARLDNALWQYESSGRKPLPWLKSGAEP